VRGVVARPPTCVRARAARRRGRGALRPRRPRHDGGPHAETIETVSGALVVSAGATVIATGPDAAPRPLTQTEREALLR